MVPPDPRHPRRSQAGNPLIPLSEFPRPALKRAVGGVVLLLGASLLIPVPLSNLPPALLVVLIAFAYLEEDGALLCAALAGTLVLSAIALGAAWETMSAAGWLASVL